MLYWVSLFRGSMILWPDLVDKILLYTLFNIKKNSKARKRFNYTKLGVRPRMKKYSEEDINNFQRKLTMNKTEEEEEEAEKALLRQ